MDFSLPEELVMLQLLARRFIQQELLPIEREVEEKDEFPSDLRLALRKKALGLGLYNYSAPPEYGGGGVGLMGSILVHEELGKVSEAVGRHGGVVGCCRETWILDANEKQRQEYLLPFVRGEKELFVGMTEPNTGSDTSALQTRAVKKGSNYVINGTKIFVTMADRAAFGLVWAVTDSEKRDRGGITCFIVEKGTPGFTLPRRVHLFGGRGLGRFELQFDDCVVPEDNILGNLGDGLHVAARGFAKARLRIAAFCVGCADRAQDMAVDWSKKRVTFGKPLAERQAIQAMLVDNATAIHAARMMVYNAAWEAEQGKDFRVKAMMAKLFASEMACKVVDNAMQIHGAYGYSKDLALEMIYRDVRALRIAEGATEMAKSWIASKLVDTRFA